MQNAAGKTEGRSAGVDMNAKIAHAGNMAMGIQKRNDYEVVCHRPFGSPVIDYARGHGYTKIENAMCGMSKWLFRNFGLRGKVAWKEQIHNLVVTEGLNDSLDKHLKGSAYTASWFVLLTDGTPTVAAGDTMASHAGWVEVTAYSEATRPALTLGTVAAGSVDNSASPASYSINGTATVGGAGLTTNNTKGGSTGILYGAGAFTGGDKAVSNGDTLNVTVTATNTAS